MPVVYRALHKRINVRSFWLAEYLERYPYEEAFDNTMVLLVALGFTVVLIKSGKSSVNALKQFDTENNLLIQQSHTIHFGR